jgi:hypothetical protein
MKNTLLCLFLITFSFLKAQDIQKYDARLLKNHGDTIMTIYSKNHNYYNFLIFELDFSYEVKLKSEISASNFISISQFKNSNGISLKKADIQKGIFNFKEWGIVLKQNEPILIDLDDNHVLYFYDKVSNNIRFGKSPLYTK